MTNYTDHLSNIVDRLYDADLSAVRRDIEVLGEFLRGQEATEPKQACVTLTKAQIANILVGQMGWEAEDVTTFWKIARTLQ